jgi:hypothetical protein
MRDVGHQTRQSALRLVAADVHSVRADRIADPAPAVTGHDLYRYSVQANAELLNAIAGNDRDALIAAERRLVAIGGLAQIHANHLERTQA